MVSLAGPFFSKDPNILWWLNAGATALCYAYAFTKGSVDDEGEEEKGSLPQPVARIINALDYGSGRERGARK